MKSQRIDRKPPLKDFPRLRVGKNTGDVVLFTNPFTGTVVHGTTNPVGMHSEDWASACFTDFYGAVTLEND